MDTDNVTHSIDAVIDRVQALASAIHDLAHSAGEKVQGIGTRGEQTLTKFDAHFGAIQNDVQHVIQNANERVEQAVPMPALVMVSVCLVVLLVLLGLWLFANAITEWSSNRRSSDHHRQRRGPQNDEEMISASVEE